VERELQALGGIMMFRGGNNVQIEDLRHHSEEAIVSLKKLLASGASVTPDPKRVGFYEVESGSLVYYIYAPPATDKVLLLATWSHARQLVSCCSIA
jgi:hypothetical protein